MKTHPAASSNTRGRGDPAEVKADPVEGEKRIGSLEGRHADLFGRVDRLGDAVEQIKRRFHPVGA